MSRDPRYAASSARAGAPPSVAPRRDSRRLLGLLQGEHSPIVILLICAVLVGLVIGGDYGESTDEYGDFKYGEDSLHAYVDPESLTPHFDHGFYGPFYLMLASVTSDIFAHLRPGWLTSDGRHFSNYLAFVSSAYFLYLITRRHTRRMPALAAALLLLTQPMLFGHGFINQKDIPFMAFFAACMAVGLIVTDRIGKQTGGAHLDRRGMPERFRHLVRSLAADWANASRSRRLAMILAVGLAVVVAADLCTRTITLPLVLRIVEAAYHGEAGGLIDRAFQLIATDAYKTPVEMYLAKARAAYLWLWIPAMVLAFVPAAGLAARIFKPTLDERGRAWLQRQALLIAGGVVLGLCSAVRVAGPLAGALVSLVMIGKLGRRSFWPLVVYWMTACVAMFIAWPFLWADPLGRILGSVRLISDFTGHNTLFNGRLVASGALPWQYLPTFLLIQLTLPALLLALVGMILAGLDPGFRSHSSSELAAVGLWFAIPAIAVIVFHRPLYDNLRQMLFVMPALFVFAGLALDKLLYSLCHHALRACVVGLVLLPGVYGLFQLHPYQYTYYNALVGGSDGAVGRFAMDYWCTSYRRAAEYLDGVAEPGATIAVWGPDAAFVTFARPDLRIRNQAIVRERPDYAVACGVEASKRIKYTGMREIYQVKRGAAVLAVIKAAE